MPVSAVKSARIAFRMRPRSPPGAAKAIVFPAALIWSALLSGMDCANADNLAPPRTESVPRSAEPRRRLVSMDRSDMMNSPAVSSMTRPRNTAETRMRLWGQGLVATYTLPGYKELIHEHYDAFRRPDTVIDIHGVKDHANAASARVAGRAVNYAYLHRMHDNQTLKNVLRAEREGYDGVMIGVLQDPALREARSIVDIPVVGYGEVSMLTACMLGERFSFLCINPQMGPLVQQMIHERGLEARAASTTYLDCGYDDLQTAVQGKPQRFLDALEAGGREAGDGHRADALV